MTSLFSSQSANRIQTLDILRGFALAGILVINAMSILGVKGSTPAFTVSIPAAERALQDLILLLIESKFFTLFSLLFGIGFSIQIQSAERQSSNFLPRILRRMGVLLLFGLAHIFFFWDGDILVIYAVTGTALIAFRNLGARATRIWIASLLAIPSALVAAIFIFLLWWRTTTGGADALLDADASIATEFASNIGISPLANNGFLLGALDRVQTYLDLLPLLLSRIPTVLAMFLLGMFLGKSGFIRDLPGRQDTLKRVRFWGLLVGLSLMVLIVAATKLLPPTSGLVAIIQDQYLAGPILCLGYAASLALSHQANPDRPIFGWMATVGRMALTNYLTQSAVLTFISYGWGLGLGGELNGFQVLAICFVLYLLQVLGSSLWLRYFAYGPCEWLWRCATYWKPVSIRRS